MRPAAGQAMAAAGHAAGGGDCGERTADGTVMARRQPRDRSLGTRRGAGQRASPVRAGLTGDDVDIASSWSSSSSARDSIGIPTAAPARRSGDHHAGVLEICQGQHRGGARHPGPRADEGRFQDRGFSAEADDHRVVRTGSGTQVVDDGVDDRVGRDRPRQALEDAGKRFGLLPPALVEGFDGSSMDDARGPHDHDESPQEDVDRLWRAREDADDHEGRQRSKGPRQPPPRPADSPFLRSARTGDAGGDNCHHVRMAFLAGRVH